MLSISLWSVIMCGSRGGTRGLDPSLKNNKNIGFLSNTGPDPLKITKSAINVGLSSAHRPSPNPPPKNVVKVGPPLIKLSGSAHGYCGISWPYSIILWHVAWHKLLQGLNQSLSYPAHGFLVQIPSHATKGLNKPAA